METRRDHQRGPVFALLATPYGIKVDKPNLTRLDARLARHCVHSSVTGASTPVESSASAR